MIREKDLAEFRRRLLAWYGRSQRDLPWRLRPSLYKTLVSEFMLQQTRVDQALPYFHRFLKRFPNMKSLAEARLDDVVKLWEGLGYYRRAAQLHGTAARLSGKKEISDELLTECPGIGPYMHAAIASITWNRPLAVVDGNVKRVVSRIEAISEDIDRPDIKHKMETVAQRWLDARTSGDWNQAVMELGATVCTPRDPNCPECPVQKFCVAFKKGNPLDFPHRKKKSPRPHKQMVAGVIHRNGEVLVVRRPATGLLPNLWEFPGGEARLNESLSGAVKRSIRERFGVDIDVGGKRAEVEHAFSHFSITLHVFDGQIRKGNVRPVAKETWQWAETKHLKALPFPRAQKSVVEQLSGK